MNVFRVQERLGCSRIVMFFHLLVFQAPDSVLGLSRQAEYYLQQESLCNSQPPVIKEWQVNINKHLSSTNLFRELRTLIVLCVLIYQCEREGREEVRRRVIGRAVRLISFRLLNWKEREIHENGNN